MSGGARDILSINFDGSGQRNLTNHPASDSMPSWSPTGREIAFVSKRDGNSEIYVMDATGENPRRLTSDPATDFQPNWFVPPAARAVSPQGQRPFTWGWLKQVAPSR